ncbi:MAG TPA: AMP-binding protein [Chloroflexota bacterium]|nr:AMP-binding protein [Chloroflexota bacterium]
MSESLLAQSYVHGASALPLLGMTIGDLFDQTAALYGEREALVSRHQGLRYSYAALQAEVNRAARGLLALSLQKGDRLGIWSPNCAEWVTMQFATPKVGVIMVNINPAYQSAELEYALRQSGISVLVLAPGFKKSDYLGILRGLCPEIGVAPGSWRSARLPDLREVVVLGGQAPAGMRGWQDLLALGERVTDQELARVQAAQQFDDPINIQYTSGTTGFPKGATLSHHNIVNNGFFIGETMHFTEQDRLCIPVPFYHCFGMVLANLACVTHGSAMILPSEGFEPLAVLETVQAERCTALHGVPTMFIAELEHPRFAEFDLTSLRTGIMAGSPCPVEVMKKVNTLMHMPEVTIAYGMTETSPVSFQTRVDDPLDKRVGTVGRVHPHVEAKVIDPATGYIVPPGTPGELCTRGYMVMLGYWNNEEGTAAAIDAARWMHTGDLATIDEQGYCNIVGRIKDMIIRGGENIYPREVEEFLYTHPKVQDVQVIGVPSVKYGEEVMAWIRLKDGVGAEADEIREYCRGQIAHYKVPAYVKFVDGFPMTITGKVQKFKMREAATEELGLQQAAAVQTA